MFHQIKMQLSKNKKYQFLFFLILSIYFIFNGGNSNLLIQFNFIFFGLLFLFCLRDKNYQLHFKNFYIKNKISLIFFLFFLFYLVLQILPLPLSILKILSPEKFNILNSLKSDTFFSSISLSPSNSLFQIFNVLTLLFVIFIMNMIFYTEKHRKRFYVFLSFSGFYLSFVAVILYLNGNPDIFFLKKLYYKDSSTGFFVNRTAFSVFLLFCLISSLEVLKSLNRLKYANSNNFFLKIYIRLFVVFITIGIITTFSRIGNFLLLLTILIYLLNEFIFRPEKNKSFKLILILIVLIDIFIIGYYFGSEKIVDRFNLLNEEFSNIEYSEYNLSRMSLIKFSIFYLKDFLFFGYGLGGFENLFKINYINNTNFFANHAHSDIVEYIGSLGLIGFLLLISCLAKFFFKIKFNYINITLFSYLFIILIFDFSLQIPIIQILFIIFFILNNKISTVPHKSVDRY